MSEQNAALVKALEEVRTKAELARLGLARDGIVDQRLAGIIRTVNDALAKVKKEKDQ